MPHHFQKYSKGGKRLARMNGGEWGRERRVGVQWEYSDVGWEAVGAKGVERWAGRRKGSGHRVLSPMGDGCTTSHHLHEPKAHHHWPPLPHYSLLVGWGSHHRLYILYINMCFPSSPLQYSSNFNPPLPWRISPCPSLTLSLVPPSFGSPFLLHGFWVLLFSLTSYLFLYSSILKFVSTFPLFKGIWESGTCMKFNN